MLTGNLAHLLSVAGPALGLEPADLGYLERWPLRSVNQHLVDELRGVLTARDGFYAFESALHVRPATAGIRNEPSLSEWNASSLWAASYASDSQDCFFFAEDGLAAQICLWNGAVARLDPETGALEQIAPDLETWAGLVLADPGPLTAFPLVHGWQAENGPLAPGQRLFPRLPFVLGGKYECSNLRAFDTLAGIRFLASIARQIRDLPEGSPVEIKIID